jgi:hypothetical protein
MRSVCPYSSRTVARLSGLFVVVLGACLLWAAAKLAQAGWRNIESEQVPQFCEANPRLVTTYPGPRVSRGGEIIVRDFEAPLRSLVRREKQPPANLSLGGTTIEVITHSGVGSRLFFAGGEAGLGLRNSGSRPVRVDWDATLKVREVQRSGSIVGPVSASTRRIEVIRPKETYDLRTPTPDKAGYYRIDLKFKAKDGSTGRFHYYIRVVPLFVSAQIATDARRYSPGEIVFARVENRGTETLKESSLYRIEVETASGWLGVGPDVVKGPRSSLGMTPVLAAGRGRCIGIGVPQGASPGMYRVTRNLAPQGEVESLIPAVAYFAVN